MAERYLPIEHYGIIGDLNTAALVGLNGSIDFFCFPRFDSPSVFGRLLDADKGGHFSIDIDIKDVKQRQLYLPDTNVLVTRFLAKEGIVELTDCMPVSQRGPGKQIIRIIRVIKGEFPIRMVCAPRFDYGRTHHRFESDEEGIGIKIIPEKPVQPAMRLHSDIPMRVEGADIRADFTLTEGQSAHFYLVWTEEPTHLAIEELNDELLRTVEFWRHWVAQSNYEGRWRETVTRSALVLKLLTCYDSGAVVAAPTFSLPEAVGGARNWDYRYCWIRDSAFTVYALVQLGFHQEAIDYMKWIEERFKKAGPEGQLQLMYRIDGNTQIDEEILDHWEGYKASGPLRIGNGASRQRQLDIYGELLDSVYLSNKYVAGISHDGWIALSKTVEFVCEHWQEPDDGIWEIRGTAQHFLHSRLMCWVALDRAIRLAQDNSMPAPIVKWDKTRAEIYNSIFADFWDEELQSFVQYKGGKAVDASTLMMPMVKFISPTDPKWLSTLSHIGKSLGTDALVQRYNSDENKFEGLDKSHEGSFTMCSFWYIECLARAGEVNRARLLFEKMLGYANHLGLYAEELGQDGAHLGNFPQAFTHLALISAAHALNLKLDKNSQKAWRF